MAVPSDNKPIGDLQELIDDFASRCKPRDKFLVGAEYEFFGIEIEQARPLAYEGEHGIRVLFEKLVARGWTADREGDQPIALTRDGTALTLEPGGQVELAGSPFADLDGVALELREICTELSATAAEIGVRFYQCGRQPFFTQDEIPWVPKGRYEIMKPYLAARGKLAHRMMKETASIQVSLDFESEADLDRKFKLVSRLSPVSSAMFANSAVAHREPSGMICERAQIWRETDNARCGLIPGAFEDGFGFAGHVNNALDTPMMFLYRDGWVPMQGMPFRQFLAEGHAGQSATWADWNLHLSGTFTDVRLKSYMEIRTADALPCPLPMTVPAFWFGLLYDETALAGAEALVDGYSYEQTEALIGPVARMGLAAESRGRPLLELAQQLVELAQDGLAESQRHYLQPLVEQLTEQRGAPARQFLELWQSEWQHDLEAFLDHNGIESIGEGCA